MQKNLLLAGRRKFLQQAAAGTLGLLSISGSGKSVFGQSGTVTTGFPGSINELLPSGDAVKPEMYFHPGAPRNAEPMLPKLVESWITPVPQFYIRSHGLNPKIDMANYRLSIEGLVDRPVTLTLQELTDRFAAASCTCTLTCAGNRRNEFSRIKPVGGVQWREGAIGNAEWAGVRLSEVLKAAGIQTGARHVWFDGLDEVRDGDKTFPFGGSVPLTKVFEEPEGSVGALLATHMNGQPLTMDHGMPLRSIVPGYIGARSVKWLGKIVVSDRPSPNHFVDDVYKILEADTPIQRDEAIPVYRYPVNSAICSSVRPEGGGEVLQLRGYALSTGTAGTGISRVELLANNMKSWQPAVLDKEDQPFCWRLWSASVNVNARTSSIMVRATDSDGHQQPLNIPWNPKGYLYNAWHRISVPRA